jgi:DUF971 family protein
VSRPIDVAHSPGANTLTITWADESRSVYPIPYLRGWCPCAVCQGHSIRVAFRSAPDSTRIAELWEVGAYALGVRFDDGHGDGIYTWEWLRKIAFESPPVGRKLGAFERDLYIP